VQVGLVNGGAGLCGGPSLPAIFSRLDHYQSWIAAALAEVDSRASELDVLTGVGPGVAQAEQFVSRELGDGTASKQP
jgi:secreted trypsin-like serine protease